MKSEQGSGHSRLAFQQNLEDCELSLHNPLYGSMQPFTLLGCQLYKSPQNGMLIFTILLTLTLQTVVLKFVFFGVHFYMGCLLCAIIMSLLLSLGFSNPGLGFQQYEQLQYHMDVEGCSQECSHPPNLNHSFRYFCQKCGIPTGVGTKHCNMCGVCVYNYDHHCVFIGKCVGGNNMGRFKLFLFLIFGTLIYGFVSALASFNHIQQVKT